MRLGEPSKRYRVAKGAAPLRASPSVFSFVVLALSILAPRAAIAQGAQNPEAVELAREGLAASKESNWEECIAKDKASLEIEDNPRTRIHLAACLSRAGKLLESLKNAKDALEKGLRTQDEPLTKVARERVMELLSRVPKVTFVAPEGGVPDDLEITFDGRDVPVANMSKNFSIEPGIHKVKASGSRGGVKLVFEQTYDVKEGETLTVVITLNALAAEGGFVPTGLLNCFAKAKTQKEFDDCLPKNQRNLISRVALDNAVYTDSANVHVYSPALRASLTSPTSGWNVGASYLIDFVTAASPDIVSTASRRYRERRHVGAFTAGYKPKEVGVQAHGNVSSEPDYLSITGGAALSFDLKEKMITPRIGFSHTSDTVGRSGTPFSIWSKQVRVEELEASSTFIISPTAVFLLGATIAAERGDQSKPYRYVPTFAAEYVRLIPPGASVDLVNLYRSPARPTEQLPTERDRYSIGMRFAKRMSSTTIRLEERIYADTWGILASSTDGRLMVDLGKSFRVWPHGRFHAQSGASFYQHAYPLLLNNTAQVTVPTFRTTDRELSPLRTYTGGGGARLALTPPLASTQIGVTVTADVMYTQYTQALYLNFRTAFYGALSIDAEF